MIKLSLEQKKAYLLSLAKKEKYPKTIKWVAFALISSKLITWFSGDSLYWFFIAKKTFSWIIDIIEYKGSKYAHLKPFDWWKLKAYLLS